ncbi:MAG TPA: hypothetical protein VFZ47_10850 [Chitinophagaceae bacterium]
MKRMFRIIFLSIFLSFVFTITYSNPFKASAEIVAIAGDIDDDGDDPRSVAEIIVQEVLDAVGSSSSFIVRAARIPNAAAAVANGKKYILYNPYFMAALQEATGSNRWVAVAVLAHEIGHHLIGHTSTHTTSVPESELEADAFSGYVLRRMGASLEDAQLAIRALASKRESSTHPARNDRILAIAIGWQKADRELAIN